MVNPSEERDWPLGVYAKVQVEMICYPDKQMDTIYCCIPKKEIDIVVDAIAPEKPGRYIHYWRLYDENDVPFGDRIWLDMVVVLEKPVLDRPEVLNDSKSKDKGHRQNQMLG